jgi:short chain dehydrogenase
LPDVDVLDHRDARQRAQNIVDSRLRPCHADSLCARQQRGSRFTHRSTARLKGVAIPIEGLGEDEFRADVVRETAQPRFECFPRLQIVQLSCGSAQRIHLFAVHLFDQILTGREVPIQRGDADISPPCDVLQRGLIALFANTTDTDTMFARSHESLIYSATKVAVNMLTVKYANAFRDNPETSHIKINAVTPGYVATDLNAFKGVRSTEQGAQAAVYWATIGADGASGGFFDDRGSVAW